MRTQDDNALLQCAPMSDPHAPESLHGTLLVGSVPLPDAPTVFRIVAPILGPYLRRMPDGETGERTYWMVFQLANIAENPAFRAPLGRIVRPFLRAYASIAPLKRIANAAMAGSQAGGVALARIKPGVRVEDIRLGSLGYLEAARSSYSAFVRLKHAGVIRPRMRFQVALPTPLAPLDFFGASDQARLLPVYERRLVEEVAALATVVPPNELSIQWDTAVEFAMLEGVWPSPFGSPAASFEPIVAMLGRIGNAIPAEVELGYHLCYGDAAHKHFVEPRDTARMADVTTEISKRVTRPVTWLHFPVPRNRLDAAYLQPMAGAQIAPETELYVGLVHASDDVATAHARVATAQQVLRRPFGVAAECGLGRSLTTDVPGILKRHAVLSAESAIAQTR
jgi:hypothetical protein